MPELREYQKSGVAFLKAARRAILADSVGTGKSTMALHAVAELDALPCIIVCPASVKLQWALDEIRKWYPSARVHVVMNGKDPIPPSAEWVVINYDRLAARLPDLLRVGHHSIILDEASAIKNGGAKRSKAAKILAWKCDTRFLLSATPMMNRPEELIHPLTVIGRFKEVATDWLDYVTRFCDAHQVDQRGRLHWDTSGASNLAQLNRLLFQPKLDRPPIMLRRRKEDILPELPVDTEIVVPVQLSNMVEYRKAEDDFKAWLMEQKIAKAVAESGRSLTDDELAELFVSLSLSSEPSAAVRVEKLRQVVARGKLDAAQQWLEEFADSTGEKCLAFAHHREVVLDLARRLGPRARYIMGGLGDFERRAAVESFMRDPSVKFLVCSVKAAGMGLNLTAASTCLFVETTYTPSDLAQARGRINRLGQTADKTVSYYLSAPGTVEGRVWQILRTKSKNIVDTIGGIG